MPDKHLWENRPWTVVNSFKPVKLPLVTQNLYLQGGLCTKDVTGENTHISL